MVLAVSAFWAAYQGAGYSYDLYQKGAASEHWVETEAQISRFEFRIPHRAGSGIRSGPISNPHADVTYNYTVKGVEYTGTELSFGPYSKGQLIRPKHGRAKIYYNPDNPKDSVYIKGVSMPNLYFMGVLGLIALIGLLFLFLGIRRIIKD